MPEWASDTITNVQLLRRLCASFPQADNAFDNLRRNPRLGSTIFAIRDCVFWLCDVSRKAEENGTAKHYQSDLSANQSEVKNVEMVKFGRWRRAISIVSIAIWEEVQIVWRGKSHFSTIFDSLIKSSSIEGTQSAVKFQEKTVPCRKTWRPYSIMDSSIALSPYQTSTEKLEVRRCSMVLAIVVKGLWIPLISHHSWRWRNL